MNNQKGCSKLRGILNNLSTGTGLKGLGDWQRLLGLLLMDGQIEWMQSDTCYTPIGNSFQLIYSLRRRKNDSTPERTGFRQIGIFAFL